MTDLDYLELRQEDAMETADGYQLETYQNRRTGKYAGLLREGRFGPVVAATKGLGETDMEQLWVAAEDGTPMGEVLEP